MSVLALLLLVASSSETCAPCHRSIYDSYRRTPMAVSSGVPGRGLFPEKLERASFTHALTGFQYEIRQDKDGLVLQFHKATGGLHGIRALTYFIGSGAKARSYMLAGQGFLYQAPVAYYSATSKWDLAPAYDGYAYPYLARPIAPACLNCHASFLDVISGAQNRYGTPPFGEGGVACQRCHGDGDAHVRSAGRGAIINPSRLTPRHRDSICSQCHLTGEARVMRPGRDWRSFRPGDDLAESMTVFLRTGTSGLRVTSHVESLAESACKRAAGDRLWCGSCHDPHARPVDRASWYRAKCAACHKPAACTGPGGPDCAGCHMPSTGVVDAQHVVYTDHSIPRRPRAPPVTAIGDLAPFGGGRAHERDLGLAYAIVGTRERSAALQDSARMLLERAEKAGPEDVEVLVYLAELHRNGPKPAQAIPLFERALRLDPAQVAASVGLGGIRMERSEYAEAIRLWRDALSRNAGLPLVRMNLGMALWRNGDREAALATLEDAVARNPGFAAAVELLDRLRRAPR